MVVRRVERVTAQTLGRNSVISGSVTEIILDTRLDRDLAKLVSCVNSVIRPSHTASTTAMVGPTRFQQKTRWKAQPTECSRSFSRVVHRGGTSRIVMTRLMQRHEVAKFAAVAQFVPSQKMWVSSSSGLFKGQDTQRRGGGRRSGRERGESGRMAEAADHDGETLRIRPARQSFTGRRTTGEGKKIRR
ncbi:hypothetical protein L1887_48295 [Cichorium endivia]|nr:hypothetical protein L1887_48295 [Cichorium endivia]